MSSFITQPRDPQKGCHGVDYFLISNYADVIGTVDASGYTTFAAGVLDPSVAFTKITPRKQTSSWDENGPGSVQQASQFYNQIVTMVIPRNNTTTRYNIEQMGNAEMIVIVRERSGNNIALGVDNGLDMNPSATASGTGPGDLAGSTIILTGDESHPHTFLTDEELAIITPA